MDALSMWNHLLESEVAPQARELYERAMDLGQRGDWRAAVAMFEGCIGQLERVDAPLAAPANHSLAVLLQKQGDHDGALFHCVRSIYLYESREDLGGMYAGLRNLSVVHQSRSESKAALEAQSQAARIRHLLEARGELTRVQSGRDRYGEPLVLLSAQEARARLAAVRDVG